MSCLRPDAGPAAGLVGEARRRFWRTAGLVLLTTAFAPLALLVSWVGLVVCVLRCRSTGALDTALARGVAACLSFQMVLLPVLLATITPTTAVPIDKASDLVVSPAVAVIAAAGAVTCAVLLAGPAWRTGLRLAADGQATLGGALAGCATVALALGGYVAALLVWLA